MELQPPGSGFDDPVSGTAATNLLARDGHALLPTRLLRLQIKEEGLETNYIWTGTNLMRKDRKPTSLLQI